MSFAPDSECLTCISPFSSISCSVLAQTYLQWPSFWRLFTGSKRPRARNAILTQVLTKSLYMGYFRFSPRAACVDGVDTELLGVQIGRYGILLPEDHAVGVDEESRVGEWERGVTGSRVGMRMRLRDTKVMKILAFTTLTNSQSEEAELEKSSHEQHHWNETIEKNLPANSTILSASQSRGDEKQRIKPITSRTLKHRNKGPLQSNRVQMNPFANIPQGRNC